MVLSRRNFFKAALAMPVGASLVGYEALAAPAQGQVKITAIKTLRLKGSSVSYTHLTLPTILRV